MGKRAMCDDVTADSALQCKRQREKDTFRLFGPSGRTELEKEMHLIPFMKKTGRESAKYHRLITAACLLALATLQPGANGQAPTLPPDVKQRLLNYTILPNGQVVPRRRPRPFVPLKGKLNQVIHTNPSESALWRSYLKN